MMLKKYSLKKQIIILFIIAAFIPMILMGFISYTLCKYKLINDEVRSQTQIMNLTSSNILQKLSYFNNLTKSIYYNEEIMACLEKSSHSPLTPSELSRIKGTVDSLLRTDQDIFSFNLLTLTGDVLYWNDGYSSRLSSASIDQAFLDDIYSHNGSGTYSSPSIHSHSRKYPPSQASIMYGRLIKSISNNFKTLGILIIQVDVSCFDDVIKSSDFSSEATIFLANQDSDVIWAYNNTLFPYQVGSRISGPLFQHSDKQYLKTELSGTAYYRFSSSIEPLNYTCYTFLPESIINHKTQAFKISLLSLTLANFIFLLIVLYLLTRRFIYPIQKLSILMNEQKYTQAAAPQKYQSSNEIGYLYSSFDSLTLRTFDLLQKLKTAAQTEAKQQLELLHAQLNPHFLYNTLDTISWMAKNGQNEEIPEIVSCLSNILRYSIKNHAELVSIEEELCWLDSYLSIQEYRFENLFTVTYEINRKFLACKVPRFILQPFIENTLVHGFSRIHSGGMIRLVVEEEENDLLIFIEDNGIGMDEAVIRSVMYGKNTGIGIKNTHHYIEKKFNRPYGIKIQSTVGKGTTVIIRLPKILSENGYTGV